MKAMHLNQSLSEFKEKQRTSRCPLTSDVRAAQRRPEMGVRTCYADEKCRYIEFAHAGVNRAGLGAVEEMDWSKPSWAWRRGNNGQRVQGDKCMVFYKTSTILH